MNEYPDRGLNLEFFQTDPAAYLEKAIKEYVATSPINCIPSLGNQPIFDEPLIVFADGDAPVITGIAEEAGDYMLTPRQFLERTKIGTPYKPERVSIISMALPFHKDTRLSERAMSKGCSLEFNYTRFRGGMIPFLPNTGFLDRLGQYIESLIVTLGYSAVAPFQVGVWNQSFRRGKENCRTPISNWSDRHIAEACGLGTFGLHGSLITAKGVAVNLSHVICDIPFEHVKKPVKTVEHNCLFYRDRSCRECMKRCPGGAITELGRDPLKCHSYSFEILPGVMKELGKEREQIGFYFPCGKCMVGVPCEDRIPASTEKVLRSTAEHPYL